MFSKIFAAAGTTLAAFGITAAHASSFGDLVPIGGAVDVSPLLTAGLDVLLAGGIGLGGTGVAVLTPFLAKYLGRQVTALVTAQTEQLLDRALSYGVEMARQRIAEHGPFKVDPGNAIVSMGLRYADDHGGAFAKRVIALEQKLISRLDTHLGTQSLRAEVATGAQVAAPEAPLDLTPAVAKAA